MPMPFYDAVVPTYLQILRGTVAWLAKAEAETAELGIAEADAMDGRLVPDMFPFNRQVRATAMHSQSAIEGARKGLFSPDMTPPPATFAGLRDRLGEAVAYLEALDPGDFDLLIGQPMRFVLGDTDLPFMADQFLLSFSMPNFFFHTTTAYAIMRSKGVALGKRDYLSQLRIAT